MADLPDVMVAELAACVRDDCAVREARGEFGAMFAGPTYLGCETCGQIWELVSTGGHFLHWDKSGTARYAPAQSKIGSKWPRTERQCTSEGGGLLCKRMEDAPMRLQIGLSDKR